MANTHTLEFKIKAVEEALRRPKGVSLDDMAVQFNISPTTLSKWIKLYREDKLTIAGSVNQTNTNEQPKHQEQQKNQNHNYKSSPNGNRGKRKDIFAENDRHINEIKALKAKIKIKDKAIAELVTLLYTETGLISIYENKSS